MTLNREVSRPRLVEDNLEAVQSLTIDAETGQRGFLLTGDESYLAPFDNAAVAIGQRMADLRALAQGDPNAQQKLDALQAQIDGKFSEMCETIARRRSGGLAAVLPIVEMNRPSHDGVSTYIADITDRKQVEEEMKRLLRAVEFERGRFRAILDSAANAIVYFDAMTGQVLANPVPSVSSVTRSSRNRVSPSTPAKFN